jgi:hypothetical protein
MQVGYCVKKRSRFKRLISKIHAVVNSNGLPAHLALVPGEAHDNQLCSVLRRHCALGFECDPRDRTSRLKVGPLAGTGD